jgi:hypothetical protein
MSILPDEVPPRPEPSKQPPLDLQNVFRQVALIQDQLKKQREAKESK